MEVKYISTGFVKKHIKLGLFIVWMNHSKLYFMDFGGWADRNTLMMKVIKEALNESNIRDLPLLVINTQDNPINKYFQFNIFSFSEKDGYYDKIIPDWTYDSWLECGIPEFNKFIKEIEESGKILPKISKIGRIGNFKTNQSRLILAKLGKKYPKYLDIMDSNNTKYISLPDLVKTYKYLIDVEGNGFSGRLKYLFFSGRPVFVQERKFKEYALMGAVPYKDYIPVKNDFSDLIEKIHKYFNDDKIDEIGKNGQYFAFKNINKEKSYEYIRKQFKNSLKFRFNSIKIILFTLSLFIICILRITINLICKKFKI